MKINKKEIEASVESMLPEALEGFKIHTSAMFVRRRKTLVDFLLEALEDDFAEMPASEKKKIIINVIDNWKF